ncbi:MAG: aldo/keto reductase [Bifidobacteriaceae bacterium]|jgi:aryl-alcohol dehydrogenase-like predicted oxidoreductase|nr:aldo/keto reductase [Bifidobacteriaceae bacterium]
MGRQTVGAVRIAGRATSPLVFGTARLTGGDGWGEPADPDRSRQLVRHAVAAGYNHLDTADSLGPGVAERIIGEALDAEAPVLVATKVGMLRPGPGRWGVLGHPDYLRQQVHASRSRLRRDRLDLVYLHRVDPDYPLADQLGALEDLREQGVIGHVGISEPTPGQLAQAASLVRLAAVQSHYSLIHRANRVVAEQAEDLGVPFVAYWALAGHGLDASGWRRLEQIAASWAEEHGLGWLQGEPDGSGAGSARERTVWALAAWLLADLPGASLLVGSRSADHLRRDRLVLDNPLAAEAAKDLAARVAASPLGATANPLGPVAAGSERTA